ncbi:hypothetical protein L9F63_023157, partial [Diploptera punctata]
TCLSFGRDGLVGFRINGGYQESDLSVQCIVVVTCDGDFNAGISQAIRVYMCA